MSTKNARWSAILLLPILGSLAAGTPTFSNAFENNKTASGILSVVEKIESKGYGPISEVSLDDGVWEIETKKESEWVELKVDPKTEEIISEHRDDANSLPPNDALKLSELLKTISQNSRYTDITEASFERRYWEIDVKTSEGKFELHVDPVTAKVISERKDH